MCGRTPWPLSLRIVRGAEVVAATEERCVLVSAPRQLPSSPNSRRGSRTRTSESGDITIEWQRGPAGTWVTLETTAPAQTILKGGLMGDGTNFRYASSGGVSTITIYEYV